MWDLASTYPVIVLAVLVCAYNGWKWYRHSRQPRMLNDTLTDAQVIADFQRRRRIFLVAISIFGFMLPICIGSSAACAKRLSRLWVSPSIFTPPWDSCC